MKDYIITLWTDPAKFTAAVRSLVGGLGLLVTNGVITVPIVGDQTSVAWYISKFIGIGLAVCAWFWKSGDHTATAVMNLPDESLRQLKSDLKEIKS